MLDRFDVVTLDFHNTLMKCDDWFQLEIHDLLPCFLDWLAHETGDLDLLGKADNSRELYRTIRADVMVTGVEVDAADCVRRVLGQLEIDLDCAEVERGLEAIMRPTVEGANPMPGASDLVMELANQGVRMAVISSAVYHPFLEWTLDRHDLLPSLELIITSASSGLYKSSPAIYEYAAEKLGAKTARCLHIGDSWRFDVVSARQAGFETVFVSWGKESIPEHVEPDLAVETLVDLGDRLTGVRQGVPDAF